MQDQPLKTISLNCVVIQSFSQTFASILTRFAQLYMSPQNVCYNPQLRFENDRYPQNKYSNSFEESNQIE